MKDKCLFLLYAYYPFENANTNVVMPIIKRFSTEYDVEVLTLNYNNKEPNDEMIEGVRIIRYSNQNRLQEIINNIYYCDLSKKRKILITIILAVLKAIISILKLFPIFQHPEYRQLKKLLKNNKYEFVLSTCESFLSCLHVLWVKKKGKLNCKWFTYFTDPFATYYKNTKCKKYLYEEQEIHKYSDMVFMTEELFSEYKEKNISIDSFYKFRIVKFANFNPLIINYKWNSFIENKVNCVFAGSFINEYIRSPYYFLKLTNYLPDNVVIHMICNKLSQNSIDNYNMYTSNKNLIWYHDLPFDLCKSIINNADILINISNRVSNQLPSKVFDYIATGRPIINIYSNVNDTSKKYLQNYPLVINVFEDENLEDNANKINDFISDNYKKRVSLDELNARYKDYTSKKIVDKIYDDIYSLLKCGD